MLKKKKGLKAPTFRLNSSEKIDRIYMQGWAFAALVYRCTLVYNLTLSGAAYHI